VSEIPEKSYVVILTQARIVVRYVVPRVEADFVDLQLQNSDGLIVDSWTIEEPVYDSEHQPPEQVDLDGYWRLLHNLYVEVHRYVTGWDKVVNDVEKALA
jgi:hypothetical protein